MAQQSPDYKQLYREEQRKRQAAEQAQEEAERAQEEAERAQEEAERAQQKVEEKTRRTTLPELLDGCHVHLHAALAVQTDKFLSTKGDPANAKDKVRPERILAWDDFPQSQEAVWKDVQRSNFMHQRHFTSLHTLSEFGETLRPRMLSSELDLNHFERYTVEDQVTSIIKELYNHPSLRAKFCLKGSVKFENHANTLSPEGEIEENMQTLSLAGRRRSPRILAQTAPLSSRSFDRGESTTVATAGAARVTRPRADQFCVYNMSNEMGNTEYRIPAFIIEYKAPHKLHLGCIYEGLHDMDLEEVIRCRGTDSPQDRFRRLVAAAITQAFSYMVRAGLEYGYVCTGEAFIFLRVPDDPKIVYYFLSVPQGDVGEATGLTSDASEPNRLHLTAVGQVLAFTLQALRSPPRSQSWQADAVAQLKTWEVVYDELLDQIRKDDIPSSEYRPPSHNIYLRMSPIRLRPRPAPTRSPGCGPPVEGQHSDDESGPDPETPSRPPRFAPAQPLAHTSGPVSKASSGQGPHHGGKNMQYCTQKCLRGMVDGSSLDKTCPNVDDHGGSHRIDQANFIKLMRQQLTRTLDIDCKPVGLHGSRGALFMIRLTSHGYTVAAKCTTAHFVPHLQWEAAIYECLRSIQGNHVPVYLGSIHLENPYIYDGIAQIVHMMFIGFGGQPIFQHINAANKVNMIHQVESSIQAVHQQGVLHRDMMPRNILWNAKIGQAMIIDFERAEVPESRVVLGTISSNRKRKQETSLKGQQEDAFGRERRLALRELRW